jgi:hypothetical protein
LPPPPPPSSLPSLLLPSWLLVALLLAQLTVAAPGHAASGDVLPRTYAGAVYGAPDDVSPTAQQPQSKLWFHDGAWWALMVRAGEAGVGVHELMPDHTWRPTGTVVDAAPSAVADVLSQDDLVHAVTRRSDGTLQVVTLAYDGGARAFRPTSTVDVAVAPQAEDVTIARDTLGRLWLAWTVLTRLAVTRSGPDGRNWLEPFTPTPEGLGLGLGEKASIVAFDASVGVMWSDQDAGAFHFAEHRDSDPDDVWVSQTPLAGPAMADDHVNLKVLDGDPDVLVAAVKTSKGDLGEGATEPSILVLVRPAAAAAWTSAVVGTVAERLTRPVVLLDRGNRLVYVFAAAGSGRVVFKTSPLDELAFAPGPGGRFVDEGASARLSDPTSTKQSVHAGTGLVVLASDTTTARYSHAESALPAPVGGLTDLPDDTPPSPPPAVTVRAVGPDVQVSWEEALDGTGWAPAREGVPATSYVVYRDGEQVATTQRLRHVEQPPGDPSAHRYAVEAVDLAGNRSGLSPEVGAVAAAAPQSGSGSRLPVAVALLVGVAGLGLVTAARRRRHVPRT